MMFGSTLLTVCGIVFGWMSEVIALYYLTQGDHSVMLWWHLAAACLTAAALCNFTQTYALPGEARRAALLYFMLSCALPFGVMFLVIAAFYGMRNPRAKKIEAIQYNRIPPLPFKPLEIDNTLAFASGGMFDVLRHSEDDEKRLLAVTATTRMRDADAVPLLKIAMRDKVDDVRLLAYSITDKIESRLNSSIRTRLDALETSTNPTSVHRSIAFAYWELAYLELVEGDLKTFTLNKVLEHAELTLAHDGDRSVSMLIARAQLQLNNLDVAQGTFLLARAQGAAEDVIAPFLAEIAFLRADFAAVAPHLARIGGPAREHPSLRALCDIWLPEDSAQISGQLM
jgi:hypothetical protein